MKSLRKGLWPFNEGNWKDNHEEEAIKNYLSKEEDFTVI
jgi:hypothetical protein